MISDRPMLAYSAWILGLHRAKNSSSAFRSAKRRHSLNLPENRRSRKKAEKARASLKISTKSSMGPSQYVIDSSVFVAFYADTDAHHADAVAFFASFNEATLIVHPYVIQETTSVLCYKLGYSAAVPFLEHVLKATNIIIPPVVAA